MPASPLPLSFYFSDQTHCHLCRGSVTLSIGNQEGRDAPLRQKKAQTGGQDAGKRQGRPDQPARAFERGCGGRESVDHRASADGGSAIAGFRSEEHTSELQSLMRISYAVFCLKKKNKINTKSTKTHNNNTHRPYTITRISIR